MSTKDRWPDLCAPAFGNVPAADVILKFEASGMARRIRPCS
jgi:hypothetical protein